MTLFIIKLTFITNLIIYFWLLFSFQSLTENLLSSSSFLNTVQFHVYLVPSHQRRDLWLMITVLFIFWFYFWTVLEICWFLDLNRGNPPVRPGVRLTRNSPNPKFKTVESGSWFTTRGFGSDWVFEPEIQPYPPVVHP